ncbi:MAG: response regulator [Candidatus Methanoperedens sp.]|nr:response regulator [Candidatus Methanoperedens sp.]MCE8429809.1 response regulator [Candidatus Methanoperedens sp.]
MAQTQILVVEDESIVAEDIKRSLQMLGYVVPSIVSTGEMAIKKVEELHPDLVMMDIMLKGKMDGIEAAGQIHAKYNIPIVYLTAFSDDKILERAKVTEPLGYIIKPFKERELYITIEMALFKHDVQKKLKESKEFYESILEGIVTGVWVTDGNDVIIFANRGMNAVAGINPQQLLGTRIDDFQEFFKPYYLRAKESIQPFHYQAVPFRIPNENPRYQSGWLIPRIKDGKFNGMICTVESIHTQAG